MNAVTMTVNRKLTLIFQVSVNVAGLQYTLRATCTNSHEEYECPLVCRHRMTQEHIWIMEEKAVTVSDM